MVVAVEAGVFVVAPEVVRVTKVAGLTVDWDELVERLERLVEVDGWLVEVGVVVAESSPAVAGPLGGRSGGNASCQT